MGGQVVEQWAMHTPSWGPSVDDKGGSCDIVHSDGL